MPPVKSCHFGFTIHFIVFLQNLYSTILPHLINQIRQLFGCQPQLALVQWKFKCFIFSAWLSYVSHSIDICTEAIKNIRNTHVVSTNRIPNFLHFIDKCSYNLQEIMKISYIYSRILENPKVAGLQLKISLKRFCPNFERANLARRNIYNLAIAFT